MESPYYKVPVLECEAIGTEVISCPACHKTAELIITEHKAYIACECGYSQNKP